MYFFVPLNSICIPWYWRKKNWHRLSFEKVICLEFLFVVHCLKELDRVWAIICFLNEAPCLFCLLLFDLPTGHLKEILEKYLCYAKRSWNCIRVRGLVSSLSMLISLLTGNAAGILLMLLSCGCLSFQTVDSLSSGRQQASFWEDLGGSCCCQLPLLPHSTSLAGMAEGLVLLWNTGEQVALAVPFRPIRWCPPPRSPQPCPMRLLLPPPLWLERRVGLGVLLLVRAVMEVCKVGWLDFQLGLFETGLFQIFWS